MPDLALGLEAGLEPKPEAGYSTASRRGSLARTRDVMLLFRQRNGRTGSDPGDIKTREPGRLLTSSLTSLSIACVNSCVKSAQRIILFAVDALSWTYHFINRER